MKAEAFSKWIEEHYDELVAVAFQRTRRERRQRGQDYGQEAARETVQNAVARALDSETLAALDDSKVWPWMVDAVRGVIFNTRRGERRARRAHKEWAGAFLVEHGMNRGKHTPVPTDEDKANTVIPWGQRAAGRIVAVEPDQNDDENGHGFVGPRGAWHGEYTVAHVGPCTCSGRGRFESVGSERLRRAGFASEKFRYVGNAFSRIETGRDRERHGYSKRRAVETLVTLASAVKREPAGSLGRLAAYALGCIAADSISRTRSYTYQVIGCLNGHRTYTGAIA